MPRYHEKLIPYVTNMLKRNKDMKFLSVEVFFRRIFIKITVEEDWIPVVCQFWETVLLHPSLFYMCVHILNQFMIDVLNNMKKTLIIQRKEKKLGPPPLINTRNTFF